MNSYGEPLMTRRRLLGAGGMSALGMLIASCGGNIGYHHAGPGVFAELLRAIRLLRGVQLSRSRTTKTSTSCPSWPWAGRPPAAWLPQCRGLGGRLRPRSAAAPDKPLRHAREVRRRRQRERGSTLPGVCHWIIVNTDFVSRYASSPSGPSSRPQPDCL